jgi:hypothetical protein
LTKQNDENRKGRNIHKKKWNINANRLLDKGPHLRKRKSWTMKGLFCVSLKCQPKKKSWQSKMTKTGKAEIFTRKSEILTQKKRNKKCRGYNIEFSLFWHFDFLKVALNTKTLTLTLNVCYQLVSFILWRNLPPQIIIQVTSKDVSKLLFAFLTFRLFGFSCQYFDLSSYSIWKMKSRNKFP